MKKINRRQFLGLFGGGAVASSALLTAACKNNEQQTTAKLQEPPTDKMEYRVNPNTGDKVSLLGYDAPALGGWRFLFR